MNEPSADDLLVNRIKELKTLHLFLGKEAYEIKLKIDAFLQEIQGKDSLNESQRHRAEKILKDSQKVKKGEVRFTAWRIQKAKDIVGIRILTENVFWDKGPYWYDDSPFWLSGIRGIIPVAEMNLCLDEEFKTELKQHVAKMNSPWGKIFERGLWYFIFLVAAGIAFGFWKSNEMLIAGSIALGCVVGIVIYLVNRSTGLTTSMERRNQFKKWITPEGEINADEFLSMLEQKIHLWGPALETALKDAEIRL